MTVGPQRRSSKDVINSIEDALHGEGHSALSPHEKILSRAFPGSELSGGRIPEPETLDQFYEGGWSNHGASVVEWANRPPEVIRSQRALPTAREGRQVRGITAIQGAGTRRAGSYRDSPKMKRTVAQKGGAPTRARNRAASEAIFGRMEKSVYDRPAYTVSTRIFGGGAGPAGPFRRT